MTQWAIEDGNYSEGGGTATNISNGLVKAWNKFDMFVPEVDNSFNISGITDNGAGDFTETFINDFSNTDYLHVGEAAKSDAGSNGIYIYQMRDASNNFNLSSFRGDAVYVTSTTNRTNLDYDKISSLFWGDLA